MIKHAQDTLIAKGYPFDKLFKSLNTLLINDKLTRREGSKNCFALMTPDENCPAFNIPLKVVDSMGRPFYCIDLRNGRKNEWIINEDGTYSPYVATSASFLDGLMLIQKCWNDNTSDLAPIYQDACRVYALWVGTKLANKLVLGIPEQTKLVVKFAYFFSTRPYSGNELTDGDYEFIVGRISRTFGYQPAEVYTILDEFSNVIFPDLASFCDAIKETTDNPKMNKFNHILLQSLLIGGWFGGMNTREIIALALEYPPAFMSLVYRGLSERQYKDTDITRLALRIFSGAQQKQYMNVFSLAERNTLNI